MQPLGPHGRDQAGAVRFLNAHGQTQEPQWVRAAQVSLTPEGLPSDTVDVVEEVWAELELGQACDLGQVRDPEDDGVLVQKLGVSTPEYMENLPRTAAGVPTLDLRDGRSAHQYLVDLHVRQGRVIRLSVASEGEDDIVAEYETANHEAIRAARAKLIAREPGITGDHVSRFVAFVKHLDSLQPPVSIEAFGPEGTWTVQEQERFINDRIAADQAQRDCRAAIGAVLGISYESDPAIVALRLPANHEAIRAARAKLKAREPGITGDHVTRFIAFVKHLDSLEPPVSIEAFGPDGTWRFQEQEQFINDLIDVNSARRNWRAAIGSVLGTRYQSR